MSSIFSPNNAPRQSNPVANPQETKIDPVSYTESMLKRSGGDAKAAFYLAAKDKGIDADQFLSQLSSMGDMKSMAARMMMANPRLQKLMSLFSLMK